MAAADEEIHRSFLNVEAHGPQLLNGVHDQDQFALARQRAKGGEVRAVAVVPLHAAEQNDPCL